MSYRLFKPKSLLGLLALGVLAGVALGGWNRWRAVRDSSQWIALGPAPHDDAGPSLQEAPQKCRRWLQQARRRLADMPALAARIRIRARMFQREMLGTGRYWQAPAQGSEKPFLQTRFQWAIQQGSQSVRWQQVCDGRYLWTMTRYPHKRRLTRVDLAEVAKGASGTPSPAASAVSEVAYGLAGLLQQLQQSCRFTHWQPARIQSVPMIALYGTWRPEALAPLVKDAEELFVGPLPMDSDRLPAHLPQQVVVYLSRKELFPFRIDFRRGRGEEEKIQVVLEFFQLQVGPRVDPALFTYRPGRLRVQDETQRVLGQLRRAARRRRDETRR